MSIIISVVTMFLVFIAYLILGGILPGMWEDAQGMIFVSTIMLSGIVMGAAAWVINTIERNNIKDTEDEDDVL